MSPRPALEQARAIADTVLYEGYLLYPYRASSSKNQVRWQFGVLGPPGAEGAGIGEDSRMRADCLIRNGAHTLLTVHLRCLQLQRRTAEAFDGTGFRRVDQLVVDDERWLTWDEAVVAEQAIGPLRVADLTDPVTVQVAVPDGHGVEEVTDRGGKPAGRLLRDRRELSAELELLAAHIDGLVRLSLRLVNTAAPQRDKESATAVSFIGTHLLLELDRGEFVSMVDPPPDAARAAASCGRHRWWPILAGPRDERGVLLVSPIIVEDHAELAPESKGALFDSTEIDEILTLRVMTMTDAEKADARATDPRAAEIIDRCDAMTPEQLQDLHGVLRDPHGLAPTTFNTDVPWWDPAADVSVSPETDAVVIEGVQVSKGSLVKVRPQRRADAQDMFYAGMVARVAAVLNDVDGDTHVAVTLVDDPAAEMHDWYGRYHYFDPDELVPIQAAPAPGSDPSTEGDHQ